jgi:hypothetical protein
MLVDWKRIRKGIEMDDTIEFVNQSPDQLPKCDSGMHAECISDTDCQCVKDKPNYVPWILGGLGVFLLGGLAISAYRAHKGMPEPGTVWAQKGSGVVTTFPLREPDPENEAPCLSPTTVNWIYRKVPAIVAQALMEKACDPSVIKPEQYIRLAVRNWEVCEYRKIAAAKRMQEELRQRKLAQKEQQDWDKKSKKIAMKALLDKGDMNCTTFALWIDSGLSGKEFATKYGISEDVLFQRKKRARASILKKVDSKTAEWMRLYGSRRVSINLGNTFRVSKQKVITREPSLMKWTVLNRNEFLGTAHYSGTFSTEEEAVAYAEQQANRTRKFATFEVWKGTPKSPLEPTKHMYRGIH